MNDNKPNVFPQGDGTNNNNDLIGNSANVSSNEQAAAEEMKRKTEEQIRLRNHAINQTKVSTDAGNAARAELLASMNQTDPNTSERPQEMQEVIDNSAMSYEDMARLEDHLSKFNEKKVKMINEGTYVNNDNRGNVANAPVQTQTQAPVQVSTKPIQSITPVVNNGDDYINSISKPQFNAPFDVIPLPSEGLFYKNGKSTINVAYMTTADENILTSPNLLNSGEFLEILFNRKILDNDIRYEDLIEGDRDAIMLWLRATAYGHMYPIVVDNNGTPFETDVNLNEIKTIKLNKRPDSNGYFDFTLPLTNINLKLKLLRVGEIDEISERVAYEMNTLKQPINNTSVYKLANQIVSVNGDSDPEKIKSLSETMRIGDASALTKFMESIKCGVDMNISVEIPGGGSLKTFLPLNLNFFWPNL